MEPYHYVVMVNHFLHNDIKYIIQKLSNISNVEIITNGDVLNSKKLQEIFCLM